MKNKRIIILEGCDRTGKSTFIKFLEEELKQIGKIPFVFHLLGPKQIGDFQFNNDEKSLMQLSKYNDQYMLFRDMLNTNKNIIIILDRSSFSEFVWSKYWNRVGKYTNYINSVDFLQKHTDLLEQSLYIDYYMSNIYALEKRINESEEDVYIFTQRNETIINNIKYVYTLYKELEQFIKKLNIEYESYDNSSDLNSVKQYAKNIIKLYIK